MCCQQGGTGTVCCQLSVFAWCSHLWGGATGKRQRVWISAHKGVASLFSPLSPSASGGERCWLFFFSRAAFVLWPAEWPSGKPERAGRGFAQRHQVSAYFLHRCLLFVYLQNKRHGHLFYFSLLVPPSAPLLSVVLCFLKNWIRILLPFAVLIDLTVPTRGRFYVLQDQNSCQQFLLVCVKSGITGTYWSYELDQKETLCSSQLFYRLSPIWSFYGWIFITCSE